MTREKKHKGFPAVVYVAQHDDGSGIRYLTADKAPEALIQMGEKTKLARYLFADIVTAEGVAKLGDD